MTIPVNRPDDLAQQPNKWLFVAPTGFFAAEFVIISFQEIMGGPEFTC
jgi:hypothetical protein